MEFKKVNVKEANEKKKLIQAIERKSCKRFLLNEINDEYKDALSLKGKLKTRALDNIDIKRRKMLEKIEKEMEKDGIPTRIITYFSSIQCIPGNYISDVRDTTPLEEILSVVSSNSKKISLMISGLGGETDAATKFIRMIKKESPEGFIAIVPNIAASAATLISLGANQIFMGIHSELGPVDPQIPQITVNRGNLIPANLYLNTYEEVANKANFTSKEHVLIPEEKEIYHKKLNDADMLLLKSSVDSMTEERNNLKIFLREGSMKGKSESEIDSTAEKLIGGHVYKTHSALIMYEDAVSLGLNVKLLERSNALWKLVKEYYLRAEAEMRISNLSKLFESSEDSIMLASEPTEEPD